VHAHAPQLHGAPERAEGGGEVHADAEESGGEGGDGGGGDVRHGDVVDPVALRSEVEGAHEPRGDALEEGDEAAVVVAGGEAEGGEGAAQAGGVGEAVGARGAEGGRGVEGLEEPGLEDDAGVDGGGGGDGAGGGVVADDFARDHDAEGFVMAEGQALHDGQPVARLEAGRAEGDGVRGEPEVKGAVDVEVGYLDVDGAQGGADAGDVIAAANESGADVREEDHLVLGATGGTMGLVLADLLDEERDLHAAVVVGWDLGEARALVFSPDAGEGVAVADDLLDAVMCD